MKNNPLLMTDGYKSSHHQMYPKGTTLVYSNYTPRNVKYMPEGAKDIVVFGNQYVIKYISELYNDNFFSQPKDVVCGEAKRFLSSYLGCDYDISHFEALHDLGYLPIIIKGLDEGTVIKEKIPTFVIYNTLPEFFWLPNFLETLISSLLWKPMHSASMALGYKKILTKWAKKTDENNLDFVNFQGHDFSFRGMQHPEAAISSGLGFLTSFMGTDTIPTLQASKHFYRTDDVAFSVPASEHSVMTAYGKEEEIEGFKRLMKQFPTGILSVVSDSFDLWQVLTKFLPELKEEILARDGKLVVRPDSGNPVDIICGESTKYKDLSFYFPEGDVLPEYFEDVLLEEVSEDTPHGEHGVSEHENTYLIRGKLYKATIHNISWNRHDKQYYFIDMWEKAKITVEEITWKPSDKGVIELLWGVFGGTENEQGYKVLNTHIGAIYGDSITMERAEQICSRLEAKGFASTNIVLGVGSYSMGYSTRDNQGGAIKATYCEVDGIGREIFKDPVTDDGTKKSAKGLVGVFLNDNNIPYLKDQLTWEESETGLLQTLFKNGEFITTTTLTEIRERISI
jgi:nicotinamide phosphoribosyltransferase